MARQPFLRSIVEDGTSANFFGLASFAMCIVALLACTHRGRSWRRFLPGRQRNSSPVITAHQVQPNADTCVWQKNIMMGEKCRYPEFSGIINYDTAGRMIDTTIPTGTVQALRF